MQIKTKEIIIPKEFMEPEWQTTKVKIRKWNTRIRNEIIDQVTEFQTQQGKPISTKLQGGFSQILTVVKCITEAPWQVGAVNEIGDLDPEVTDWLYKEITELNSGGLKNPQGSEESSQEK